MNDVVRTPGVIAGEINFIKRQTSATCLNAAIEIGKLLCEAKEAVEHGEWGKWLEENVDYSSSTANNLMKLFKCYGENKQLSAFDENCMDIFGALSPSQALVLTALPEDKRAEYLQTHDVENESVREMKKQIEQLQSNLKQCENGYEQTLSLERNKLKDKDKLIKDKDKRIVELRDALLLETNRSKKYMSEVDTAKQRADAAEKQLKELAERPEPSEEQINAEIKQIRDAFENEIVTLKQRLKRAESADIQKFAIHFDLFQQEFQILYAMIEEQQDDAVCSKFKQALTVVLADFRKGIGTDEK